MTNKLKGTIWGFIAAAGLAGTMLTAVPAGAAGFTGPCSPAIGKHNATTTLSGRPDSGGGGTWADDTLTRTLSITQVSHTGGTWTWTAAVCDGGTGRTIPGALAPNQGPGHAGQVIRAAVTVSVTGTADYQFTTDQPLNTGTNLGVPAAQSGAGSPTSTWYQLAFPAGTVFGGPGLTTWSWSYMDGSFTVESWLDSSANGGGQTADAGQITGRG